MTAWKLFLLCLRAILKGHPNTPIYFDTEAKTYEYHMAKVRTGVLQDMTIIDPDLDKYWIWLNE